MASAIAYGNWKQPIEANIFGIEATWLGELRIPFACHVRPTILTAPLNVSFPQFAQLPIELQIHVLRFCDKPTRFRPMQTSHFIRTKATKLFFADSEAWYCIEGFWLEAGGNPSDGLHARDFLPSIQQVHVDQFYNFLSMDRTDEETRNCWRLVQCLFPQVKHVSCISSLAQARVDKLYRARVQTSCNIR
jgi:hypothetical protein